MVKKQQCIDNDESEDLVSDSSRNTLLDSQQQQRLFGEPDETARNDDGYCEFITHQLFHDDNNYDTVQYHGSSTKLSLLPSCDFSTDSSTSAVTHSYYISNLLSNTNHSIFNNDVIIINLAFFTTDTCTERH